MSNLDKSTLTQSVLVIGLSLRYYQCYIHPTLTTINICLEIPRTLIKEVCDSFGNNGFILFSETEQNSKKENENNDKQNVQEEEKNVDSTEEDIEPEPETTLYVKNLNFDSTDESIKKVKIQSGFMLINFKILN